ncbi:MAG: hypothetical protein U5R06_05995 [candidate division KSB1 bacterium]|nr:hypothetical protein [candidate division KSB1 bacterium]
MKIRTAFRQGFQQVFTYYKIIGIVFIVNIFAALLVTLPFATQLNEQMAKQSDVEQLLAFDYSWWQELNLKNDGILETLRPSISSGLGTLFDNAELVLTGQFSQISWAVLSLGIVYLFVAAFLNGGILSLYLGEKRKFTVQRFFSYCGQYMNHMSAIVFTALLVFLAYYKLLLPGLFALVDFLTLSNLNQTVVWFANLGGFLILFLIMIFLDIIFDYAKIIVIREKKDSSWLSIWLAIKFTFKNFRTVTGLYLSVFIASGLALLVLAWIITMVPTVTATMIILAILLQQIFILVQIIFRLGFYGTEVSLYLNQAVSAQKVKKIKR